MKKLLTLILAAAVFSSCHHITGSGNIITEKRSTADFHAISVSAGIEVELHNGPTNVVVEADDNVIRYINTTVKGNTLKIYITGHNNFTDAHLKVLVSANGITALDAASAAEIKVKDILSGVDKIDFNVSSAGKINAEVDAPSIAVEGSSAGDIHLKGRTKDLRANSSSAATIQAGDLMTETANVEVSSGAKADVHSSVSLNANASSGGDISYRGGGNAVINSSSGGSVHKRD
ncbi:MAG: head GIN domain-containing protein [Ferruginibacter sp.]